MFLRIVDETLESLRVVGISYVLPEGQLPIEARLRSVDGSIEYQILVGLEDAAWASLTESKRWKSVYANAADGAEPGWNWDRLVNGTLNQ